VKTEAEIREFCDRHIGSRLVTYQTDANGQPVSKILIETCTDIANELYLGAVVDRSTRRIVFMASTEGGVEIEKVAEETPEKNLESCDRSASWTSALSGAPNGLSAWFEPNSNEAIYPDFHGLSEAF